MGLLSKIAKAGNRIFASFSDGSQVELSRGGSLYCSVYRGGANVTGLGNGNFTVLYDTVMHDPNGWFVPANNGIKPQIKGKYLCIWSVKHDAGTSNGLLNTTATLFKNGSGIISCYHMSANTGAGFNSCQASGTAIVDINGSSDLITVSINVDRSSGTHGYTGAAGNEPLHFTRLECYYLGP